MSSDGSGWPPGGAGGYGQDGRYADDEFGADREYEGGDPRRYAGEAGYEWSEPSGRPGGRTDPYGSRPGRHSSASHDDSYGQDSYGRSGYGQDYQGWQARDGYDQPGYGQGSYGQGSYGQAGYGSYPDPGYGNEGYGQDPGQDRYARGAYGGDGYGGDYYAHPSGPPQPGAEDYGRDGYGASGPHTDSYGRELYSQGSYGPGGSSYRDAGGYAPPDGYGSENGYSSPTRSAGTGPFGRPELGGPALAGEQDAPLGLGSDPARAGGYGQWHEGADDADAWDRDEPADHEDDWQDDGNRLLSRRFSGDDGGRDRRSGRRSGSARRPRRLRGKFAVTAAILAVALVLGAVADYGYERFASWHKGRYGDYTGAGYGQVRFTVPSGAALSELGPALMKAGVIEEVRPYDTAAAAATNASHLQPGVYLLHHHMSSALAVQYLLSSAHRSQDQLTIIEGTRASAIAAALSKQTGIPASQFTQIIDHPPAALGLPSWAGKTAEGFLFPDTYTLLPKMTPLAILQMMVNEFKQKIVGINLTAAAHHVFTSPWHALIVASMIQAEAGNPGDFAKISRVVWNRLSAGMPLEFDSTVFYAMGIYGTHINATQEKFNSPYNTYQHTGLPPGPIGNPGVAAMQAAVHAAKGQWLYFITDTRHKPYKTYFANTLAELQALQREFGN